MCCSVQQLSTFHEVFRVGFVACVLLALFLSHFIFMVLLYAKNFKPLKLSVFAVCATGVYITIIRILPSQYVCVFRATLPIQQSCSRAALIGWPL